MERKPDRTENNDWPHMAACVIAAIFGAIIGGAVGYQSEGFSGILKYAFAGALAGFMFVAFWPWSIFM